MALKETYVKMFNERYGLPKSKLRRLALYELSEMGGLIEKQNYTPEEALKYMLDLRKFKMRYDE